MSADFITISNGFKLELVQVTVADLPDIYAIECAVSAAPWSEAMFGLELLKPRSLQIAVRRQADEPVCAYAFCARYGDSWHLMNIAVAPTLRRLGIARALLAALLDRLDRIATGDGQEAARVTLEVRRSNLAARRLYAQLHFLAAGVRRRYYPDNGEDALILWRTPSTLRGSLDDIPAAGTQAADRTPPRSESR